MTTRRRAVVRSAGRFPVGWPHYSFQQCLSKSRRLLACCLVPPQVLLTCQAAVPGGRAPRLRGGRGVEGTRRGSRGCTLWVCGRAGGQLCCTQPSTADLHGELVQGKVAAWAHQLIANPACRCPAAPMLTCRLGTAMLSGRLRAQMLPCSRRGSTGTRCLSPGRGQTTWSGRVPRA